MSNRTEKEYSEFLEGIIDNLFDTLREIQYERQHVSLEKLCNDTWKEIRSFKND